MEKKIWTSDKLPVAGPYSAAVEAGGFIFISGQLPVNPETGDIIMDIRAATHQILTNLQTLLEESGLSLKNIVKTTLFLKHISDFAAVNEIYAGFFPQEPPARSTVEVSALPKGVPLEIEAIAIRN
ncbi:MAG: reactive intermediate/imine deaminase [Deltaproteobacteria bacterium]|nr:reactive intermediate/imine deaminase [Deltaproteobacteria bacterium]